MAVQSIVARIISAYRSFYFMENVDSALSRWQKLSFLYAASSIIFFGYATYMLFNLDVSDEKKNLPDGTTTIKIKYDLSKNKFEKTVHSPKNNEEESV